MTTAIGNTPLVRLRSLVDDRCAEVHVKLEGANPTGSMKDRMALAMIEGAERRGDIMLGGTVVDYTGGSTGSSLAMICAARGYQAHFVSSDAFSEAKLQTMRVFGAEIDILKSDNGMITPELIAQCLARVQELVEQKGAFYTNQFKNVDNRNAYHAMADEILVDLEGQLDEFVTGVGTGGSFSGVAEVLKERLPNVRCIAIEPATCRALSGIGPQGAHRLEGIGAGFIPAIFREDLVDEIIPVGDKEAFDTARLLATREGIFGGISSGCNVWAALHRARILGPGKRVVTLICDSGLKYLESDLFGNLRRT